MDRTPCSKLSKAYFIRYHLSEHGGTDFEITRSVDLLDRKGQLGLNAPRFLS